MSNNNGYNRAFQLDLLYDKKWEEYAAEAGIENPWVKQRERWLNALKKETVPFKGIEIPCLTYDVNKNVKLTPSDEERVAWRRQEYLWKAKIIQPKVKWEDFVEWVECREGIELADFRPCDSKDGVCSFMCAKFGENCDFGK